MSSSATLTKFPDLSKYNDHLDVHQHCSCENVFEDVKPSRDVVIVGWATLLQAYTGEELPVFFVDDRAVSVDLSTSKIGEVSIIEHSRNATTIRFVHDDFHLACESSGYSSHTVDSAPPHVGVRGATAAIPHTHSPELIESALTLKCNLEIGSYCLENFSVAPSEHLDEISRQLHLTLRRLIAAEKSSTITNDVRQSIVNASPKLVEGPQLLHKLAFNHGLLDNLALDFRNADGSRTTFTYDLLRQRALQLAAKLRKYCNTPVKSTTKKEIIPVLISQSPELYVALLAVLEIGAAFCPLNLDTPADRIRFIIEDVGANVVVTTVAESPRLNGFSEIQCCTTDSHDDYRQDAISYTGFNDHASDGSDKALPAPSDWAYIMYTSGSTGQPKGVILSHVAVTQSLLAHDPLIPQFSRFLQFASPTFDVSMFEIFFTLFRGGTIVGSSRRELLNDLPGIIDELDVDAAEFTPTVAGTLIRNREDVPKMKLLLTIGEMLTKDVVREFGASSTQPSMLYGMYGPTEAAIHCTLEPEFSSNAKNGIIGRPLDTVLALIAKPSASDASSADIETLPVGHVGELVVGGHQIADGYINREEQTNAVFLHHKIYGRLYRTGDKARMLPDGSLECLGRIQSGQVKLRGQRMELGEIEQAAMQAEGCRLVVASVIRENLVVFCLVDNEDVQTEQILQACRKWLLPYMLPNDIVLRRSFPQLASGKVDKKTLETSYQEDDRDDDMDASESLGNSELTEKICQVAQDVLHVPVHAESDLRKAGLDSLRAIQLVSQLRNHEIKTTAIDVLKSRNVRSLCSRLDKSHARFDTSSIQNSIDSIQKRTPELRNLAKNGVIVEILPCTPLQASMLVETLKDPHAYCNSIELEFEQNLTKDTIVRALDQIFETNQILRSGFLTIDDPAIGFAQVVWKQRERRQIRHSGTECEKSFSLNTAEEFLRPLRISTFEKSSSLGAMVHIHHALYDGWSLDLLLQDLNAALEGGVIFERPSFRRVTEYILGVSDSPVADNARDYWEHQLSDYQPVPFPWFRGGDTTDPTLSSLSISCREVAVNPKALYLQYGLHPQVYFQSALAYLWATYLGSTDVTLGCVSSGRTLPIPDIENIVGPCISTLPLRVDLSRHYTVGQVLRTIHGTNLSILEHSTLPLQEIKRLAQVDPGQHMFHIVFIWQESLVKDEDLTSLRQVDAADFLESALLIEVKPQNESVILKASQRGQFLPQSQLDALLQQVEQVVTSLLSYSGPALDTLHVSDLNEFMSESVLSAFDSSSEIIDVETSSEGLETELAPRDFACVVSKDARKGNWTVLPLGAVGSLAFRDQTGSMDDQAEPEMLDTFQLQKLGRMWLTSTICRMSVGGQIHFLGKVNDFGYLRKQMINLETISSWMKRIPDVDDCLTTIIHDSLVTFWVPHLSVIATRESLEQDLAAGICLPRQEELVTAVQTLFDQFRSSSLPQNSTPSYMIPIRHMAQKTCLVKSFESLPSTGYLEYFRSSQITLENELGKDWLDFELDIANAVSSALKIPNASIKRSTSFFRLGLDSISAISVARALNRLSHGPNVDVSAILRYPTLRSLATHLTAQLKATPEGSTVTADYQVSRLTSESLRLEYEYGGRHVDSIRRCTSLQEGMLAASSAQAYHNHTLFELFEDASVFKHAFESMCKRHDVLRTCFASTQDAQLPFAQVVLKDQEIPWHNIDTAGDHLDSTVESIVTRGLTPLDTMCPPLSITQINSENKTHLVLSMHHALYDGHAVSRLLHEIEIVISNEPLPKAPSFENFLHISLSQDLKSGDTFWDCHLAGFRTPPLPRMGDPNIRSTSTNAATATLILTKTLHTKLSDLEDASRQSDTTIQAFCQAAWAKVLSILMDVTDVCFGNVVSGRTLPMSDLDQLVAPCFNTLPVRIKTDRYTSNEAMLKRLHKINSEALAYQFTPLRRIQSRMNTDGSPLFETLFILQRVERQLDESLWAIRGEWGDMGFPIVCEMTPDPRNDAMNLTLHVKKLYLQESGVYGLLDAFDAGLKSCINDPSAKSKDFKCQNFKDWVELHLRNEDSHHIETSRPANGIIEFENDHTADKVRQALARFSKVPVDSISAQKTIYQLGLDSISAIQVAKALRREGFQVSSEHILMGKTLHGITNLIQQESAHVVSDSQISFDFATYDRKNRDQVCSSHGIDQSDVVIVRPCTQSQAGMISQSLKGASQTYLNHMVYELNPEIDLEMLRCAWIMVISKHEMLRTGFSSCSDAKYPFVMIHYEDYAVDVPWNELYEKEKETANSPIEQLRQSRTGVAESIFRSLEQPAWRLSIARSKTDDSRIVQFSAHHALYDAESLVMIFEDVLSAYRNEQLQPRVPITKLLSAILSGEDSQNASHKDFWQSKLEGASINKFPDLTPLRVDKRDVQRLSLTTANTDIVEDCRKLGITLQAALQVAWARLISSYLGENDVTFGVVLAGRDSDEADEIAFPSTTTVPYRCHVETDINVMLQEAMEYNTSVRKHQHTPLTQITRWSNCSSDVLFDTLLVLQGASEDSSFDLWRFVEDEATVEYPLSIEGIESIEGTLLLRAVFWDDTLPVQQARILLSQLDSLLSDTVSARRSDVDLVFSQNELSRLPPTIPELVSPVKSLHGFVEATARNMPERIALQFFQDLEDPSSARTWTYQELENEGNKVANLLCDLGAEPQSLIAVCFDKCPEASISMLGILKARCGFVALDPAAPMARKAFIVKDSQASFVLTTENLRRGMGFDQDIRIVCMDSLETGSIDSHKPTASDQAQSSDVCYCLYTSGSTGTPKGCLLSHENAVQAMLAFQKLFQGRWNASSRWLQFASFHFDVSVLEQFWSWSVGICVVSTPRDGLFSDLPGALTKLNITHIDLTPSLARLITPEQVPALCKGIFITGGEPLKQEVLDAWGSTGVIHNGYGPTECTIGCTMFPQVPQNGKPSNIGWQFDNVGTYVFAPGTTQLVPRGAIGELCVSGKLVGLGYLHQAELTEECFPYVKKLGERIYRTKDLVRMLYDGSFEFLGRNDDQVKLRGQRLELGEINNAIKINVASAQEVVTIVAKRRGQQSEQLVSFLALGQVSSAFSPDQLAKIINDARTACQIRLPVYMVPSHFVFLESIPLTPNNKSDMKRLKELFEESIEGKNGEINSKTPGKSETTNPELCQTVIRILEQFLALPSGTVSSKSNIYELGLDSISVFGFSNNLQSQGIFRAQPSLIMQNPTITGLTKSLGDIQPTDDGELQAKYEIVACQKKYRAPIARKLDLNIEKVESVYPCTPLQQGMIVKSLGSDERVYFNTFLYELHVGGERLRDALEDLVSSIPLLRTVFVPVEQVFVQAVLQKPSLHKFWRKSIEKSGENIHETVDILRREWLKENETIFRMPFQAISIHRPEQSFLVLNIFHALYDATSLLLLLQSLGGQIRGQSKVDLGPLFHDALPLGPLKEVEEAASFWTNHLNGAQFGRITYLEPDPMPTYSKEMSELDDIDQFEHVRREIGVTHLALIQAAWASVLYDFIRAPTIIGQVVSGRSISLKGSERTIGPMFNTIPAFANISKKETWRSFARKFHEFNLAALPFQHTSLRDIQKWCKVPSREPLFDTLFVFQKQASQSLVDTSDLWTELGSTTHPDYPLAFEAEHTTTGTIVTTIVAQSQVADNAQCCKLLEKFETHLELILSDPDKSISDVIDINQFTSRNTIDVGTPQRFFETRGSQDFDWTPEARTLRQKIAELSGVNEASINEHTSIFELGLDSIDAIKLSSILKNERFRLPVSSVIRNPSIYYMLRHVYSTDVNASSDEDSVEVLKVSVRDYVSRSKAVDPEIESVLPVTPLQEALVAEMFSSGFENYFNHDVFRISSRTEVGRLKTAITTVCANSPILRTSFLEIDSIDVGCSFAQLVHKQSHPNWESINLSGSLTLDDVIAQARNEMISGQSNEHSSSSIPLKFSHVTDGEASYLILSISHALYDGWSISLLHDDILKAYLDRFSSRPHYEDVIDKALGGETEEAKNFWHDCIADTSGCHFPVRVQDQDEARRVHLKEHTSQLELSRIQAFCRAQSIGLQALGHFCWSFVLATYARNLDVVFGVVLSGRDDEEAQSAMFPTMNTVVTRSVISGSRSGMLKAMQENMASLLQYQHFPLRKTQAMAALGAKSLFNSLFIYQKRPVEDETAENLYTSIGSSSGVEYPVCVEMEVSEGSFLWRTACEETALSETGTEELLCRLDQVLQRVIDQPDAQSIDITNDKVSLCGLPSFEVAQSYTNANRYEEHGAETNDTARPASRIEQTVRKILSALSKIPEAEILGTDNIFHLGLDSISLIKVCALLRKDSLAVSVSDMMKAGTVQNIALSIEQSRSSHEKSRNHIAFPDESIKRALAHLNIPRLIAKNINESQDIEAVLPATSAQIFFLTQWQNTKGTLFYPTFNYEVRGNTDLGRIRNGWHRLVERNSILRTTFMSTSTRDIPILQLVLRSPIESFVDETTRETKHLDPYDFSNPPVQLHSWKLQSGSIQLSLHIHHALYDAVSLPLLIQELQELVCHDELPRHLNDVAFKQLLAHNGSSRAHDHRREFWVGYLASAENPFPSDALPSSKLVREPTKRTECYRPRSFESLSRFNANRRVHGLSVQSIFLAACASVYCELLNKTDRKSGRKKQDPGSHDVIMGIYLANRSHELRVSAGANEVSLATLPAPTLNLVPLVIKAPLKYQLYECAKQIQDDLQEISSLEHAGVGLWEIDEWSGIKIDCFINFLRIPGDEDPKEKESRGKNLSFLDGESSGSTSPTVTIKPLSLPVYKPANPIGDNITARTHTNDFRAPSTIQTNAVCSTYVPSWDIEAAIRDGALDVGVFGPSEVIDQRQAELIISSIITKLEGLDATFSKAKKARGSLDFGKSVHRA